MEGEAEAVGGGAPEVAGADGPALLVADGDADGGFGADAGVALDTLLDDDFDDDLDEDFEEDLGVEDDDGADTDAGVGRSYPYATGTAPTSSPHATTGPSARQRSARSRRAPARTRGTRARTRARGTRARTRTRGTRVRSARFRVLRSPGVTG
ncbi:hypothetical protein [Streptomyces sp. NPDC054975]